MIRKVQGSDAQAICSIYNHYIENTIITFEEVPVTESHMYERLQQVDPHHSWWVYEVEGDLAGYAYSSPWKSRSAYRFSAEATIYLSPHFCGRGIGVKLYQHLIKTVKQAGFHCLMGGIALPNSASVSLHEKLGFTKTAHFKEVGFKQHQWIDVGYWQLLLATEKDSPNEGNQKNTF